MKAEDLIKILKREKGATIRLNGKDVEEFEITFACTSNGDWVINFSAKEENLLDKK